VLFVCIVILLNERLECSGCHPIKHRYACFLGATVHSISLRD